jgi:peptidoglycan/xylan/chitin deacetylase (PgdA/CDA1 family)
MLEVLDKHRIKCGVSLNMAVLEHYPEIAEAMVQRDWDFMGHGIYNTRYIYTYTEDQEREFYRDSIDTLKRHTGKTLKGMLGIHFATERTPDLLAEAGLIYHADWMHDDQPVPIKVRSGKLVSMPYSIEIDDAPMMRRYNYEGDYFARVCKAQFDQLYKEGAQSGRVMCISLHPFISGQPHRIKYLDDILTYILSHDEVWQATADEIAEYYTANYHDQAVEHARRLNARRRA